VTKNYKGNTLSQVSNVFKEFFAIFWTKKFLSLRHGVLVQYVGNFWQLAQFQKKGIAS
jgi:hypothetical protein